MWTLGWLQLVPSIAAGEMNLSLLVLPVPVSIARNGKVILATASHCAAGVP